MSVAPLLMNLLGAFAQRGPELNPDYDNAIYNDATGEYTDANGNPINNRYKNPSFYTRMFAPDVASQITNANTSYAMAPEMAQREDAIRRGIATGNIDRSRAFYGKPTKEIPSEALSTMSGGDYRTPAIDPSVEAGSRLALNVPQEQARQSLGQALYGSRKNTQLLSSGAPEVAADAETFSDILRGAIGAEGMRYNLPELQSRAEGQQAATQYDISKATQPYAPIIGHNIGMRAASEIPGYADTITNAPTVSQIARDTLSTQRAMAGARAGLNPQIARTVANQVLGEQLASSFIPSVANPISARINADNTITPHTRNPLYSSQMEAMKYMTDQGPTLSNALTLPNGAPLPGAGSITSSGDPVTRNTHGTPEYTDVAKKQASDFIGMIEREFPNKVTRAAKVHEAAREMAKEIAKHYDFDSDPRFDLNKIGAIPAEEAVYQALTEGQSHGLTKNQLFRMFNYIPHDERKAIYEKILTKIDVLHKDKRNATPALTGPRYFKNY